MKAEQKMYFSKSVFFKKCDENFIMQVKHFNLKFWKVLRLETRKLSSVQPTI